jgi:major vault protein
LENAEITYMREKHALELLKTRKLKELEIKKAKELGEIESSKFKAMVDSIGQETLVAISKAGPEL